MKCVGIDFGLKRTGVAASDPGGRMAFPRCTITYTTKDAFFGALLALLDAEAPEAIVVGLPLLENGEESLTTRQVRNFVARLQRRCALPVYWMEEAYSSAEAESTLREAGLRGPEMRKALDQQAAVHILTSFLNTPVSARRRA